MRSKRGGHRRKYRGGNLPPAPQQPVVVQHVPHPVPRKEKPGGWLAALTNVGNKVTGAFNAAASHITNATSGGTRRRRNKRHRRRHRRTKRRHRTKRRRKHAKRRSHKRRR